jgi:DNA-binding winged helix-turn-helix (wHTH) protein/tetratricopeptide (TPR) repeat protein
MSETFGEHALDRELFQLRRRGEVVPLEPKVFDVLAYLIEHRERVVTKAELLDRLWPGETVSESVLPRCIAAARRAVGDDRTRQSVIQTLHGRGYRFVARLRPGPPAASPPPVRAPLPARDPIPFVGRDDAMRRLDAAIQEACAGRARTVLLVGEPGIGKTRAIEELAGRARARGVRVLLGRCHEGEGAPAFWPWVQVLREAFADASASPADADLATLVPELGSPESASLRGFEGEQARFRLFDGVARALGQEARRGALFIALDDLHWADEGSLRLLEFLAGALLEAPLLLVGSYRDVEVRRDHPLSRVLGALARLPRCERVALRGLTAPDVERLLCALLERTPDPGLAAAVHDLTEGNPFFVHEMGRWLAEEGHTAVGAAPALALPQSIRDAVGRRLDALTPACNAVLRAASVLGRDFPAGVLAPLVELHGDPLLEALAEALDAHVLVEVRGSPGRYAFAHALVRQTLYEELRVSERVRLHRCAGEILQAAHAADPDAHAAELAHHFVEASAGGDVEHAVTWCVRAARRDYARVAYEESARHYEQALAALSGMQPPDPARQAELLVDAAVAYSAAGAREQARERCFAAADLARRIGRTDLLARAAVEFRGGYEMGVPPEPDTLALLEEALGALGEAAPALRARLLARLAGTRVDMTERERLSREALALARASGDRDALRDALAARWWATLGPDRVTERYAVADDLLAHARELADRRMELLGLECRLGALLIEGRMPEADATLAAYAALADQLRQPAFCFLAAVVRGSRALSSGRFDDAESWFGRALALGRGPIPFADVMYGGQLFWLQLQRGDAADPAAALEFFASLDTRFPIARHLLQAVRAMIYEVMSRTGEARAELASLARGGFRELPRDEHWLLTMTVICDVVIALDLPEYAEEIDPLLEPFGHLIVVHDLIRATAGSVHALRGELAVVRRRFDEARAYYERALACERAAGLVPATLASRSSLAALARLRGDDQLADELDAEVESGCAAIGTREGRFRGRFELFARLAASPRS